MDHYKILQVSENATDLEIEQAYDSLLTKWLQVKVKSRELPRERIDSILHSIEEAYKVLSSPDKRAEYNKSINLNDITADKLVEVKTAQEPLAEQEKITKKPNHLFILLILLMLVSIIYSLYYFVFDKNSASDQSSQASTENYAITKEALDNAQKLIKDKTSENQSPPLPKVDNTDKTDQQDSAQNLIENQSPEIGTVITTDISKKEKQPVSSPPLKNMDELTKIAKKIASSADKYRNSFINKNTTLLSANASKQNIRLNFRVIEGISNSPALLDAYLNERFTYDNNICQTQEKDIQRGNAFIFAYYDNNYKSLITYMIDKEVCDSPLERRIIKKISDDDSNLAQ